MGMTVQYPRLESHCILIGKPETQPFEHCHLSRVGDILSFLFMQMNGCANILFLKQKMQFNLELKSEKFLIKANCNTPICFLIKFKMCFLFILDFNLTEVLKLSGFQMDRSSSQ